MNETYEHPIISGDFAQAVDEQSSLSVQLRQSVYQMVQKLRPRAILQVGIQSGARCVDIMEACQASGITSVLYAADPRARYFRDSSKEIGYLAQEAVEQGLFPQVTYVTKTAAGVSEILESVQEPLDLMIADLYEAPGELNAVLMAYSKLNSSATIMIKASSEFVIVSKEQLEGFFTISGLQNFEIKAARYDEQTAVWRKKAETAAKAPSGAVASGAGLTAAQKEGMEFFKNQAAKKSEAVEFYKDQLAKRSEGLEFYKEQASKKEEGLEFYKDQLAKREEALAFYKDQLAKRDEGLAFYKDQLAKRDEGLAFYKDQLAKRDEGLAFYKNQVEKKSEGVDFFKKRLAKEQEMQDFYRRFAEAKMRESARVRARLDLLESGKKPSEPFVPEELPALPAFLSEGPEQKESAAPADALQFEEIKEPGFAENSVSEPAENGDNVTLGKHGRHAR